MATVKIILRTSKINSKGEAPLCIRIIKDKKATFKFLNYRIRPDQWNEEDKRVRKSHPNSGRLNFLLAQEYAEAEAAALKLETENKHVNIYAIKESIKGKPAVEFFPYADQYASMFLASGKIGSHRRAKAVVQKVREFVNERKITFDQITVSFLNEYERHMRTIWLNKTNTIHANFRCLRTIFNNAVREELIPSELNPFPKMRLKTEKTERAYLTEEELQKIEKLVITESFMLNHHRNIYVFAAYAGGLRISDVLQLKWNNLDSGKIHIRVHKTKSQLSFKLPDAAMKIIEFYRSENSKSDDFIFPLLKISPKEKNPTAIHNAISGATAYANKNLRKIAELAKIDKHLSFHTSRHTFATRAIELGMPMEIVSHIMAHCNIRETQIYGRIMNTQIDEAMTAFN